MKEDLSSQNTALQILLVEDNPADIRLLRETLADVGEKRFLISCADSMRSAIQHLCEGPFDLILLDLTLPDSEGLNTLQRMRAAAPLLPIVVLSGVQEEAVTLLALQNGAQDYLVKGQTDKHLLVRSVRYAIWRKQAEDRLQYMATHDPVTQLPTRLLFTDRLSQALSNASRYKRQIAVLFIDVDRFKTINDTLGHPMGDLLLKGIALRLAAVVREGDTIARLGGDEFVLLLEQGVKEEPYYNSILQKIIDVFAEPFELSGLEVFVTVSIGIAVFPNDGTNADTLLQNADAALLRAKEQGRNNYQHYSSDMNAMAMERLRLETSLRKALQREEFVLHYQPIQNLLTGEIVGMEALARWRLQTGQIVPAPEFIPLAEASGLILPIGNWMLTAACQQNKSWQKAGLQPIRIAVNISARQFQETTFIATIGNILRSTGLDPKYLELEVTEGVVMKSAETTILKLRALHDTGIRISIDDFGTGYSSLNYLRHFPIHTLKIDQSFIRDICNSPGDMAIVKAIITLAHSLNLTVVAEAVETADQLRQLQKLQCDEIQGSVFSMPMSAEAATKFLTEQQHKRLAKK